MLTVEKQTEKLQLTVGGEFRIYQQQRLAHQKLSGGTGAGSVTSQILPLVLFKITSLSTEVVRSHSS